MARLQPKENAEKRLTASWANSKELLGTDRVFRGWFVDTDNDPDLDAAASAAGWERAAMSHLDGATREHWLLPSPAPLFVLIQGVPFTTMPALVKADIAYSGLKAHWPQGERSVLGFQALHPDLIAAGYVTPLPFTVRSTATDDLLRALLAHNAALDACEAASRAKGTTRLFEFYDVALPLAAGAKAARGKELQSPVSPVVCAHPDTLDVAYLRSRLAPKIVAQIAAERWGEITAWAAEGGQPAEDARPAPAPPAADDQGWYRKVGDLFRYATTADLRLPNEWTLVDYDDLHGDDLRRFARDLEAEIDRRLKTQGVTA